MYFTHRGQSPDRQQPIKEWPLKHDPFLFIQCIFAYLRTEIAIYVWSGVIGDTIEFQFAFHIAKLCATNYFDFFSDRRRAANVVSIETVAYHCHFLTNRRERVLSDKTK